MTTHTLLGSDTPTLVDTIEIERAMYEGASNFGSRVLRAYRDPRSHLQVDDARTYFSTGRRQYDVIVSEPSNPWVSGVASLFTREFYGFLREHLREGGIGIQWVQSYELDDRLLATMIAALIAEFPYVEAYTTNGADLVFVISERPLPALDYSRLARGELAAELPRVGLRSSADFKIRQIGNRDTLQALVALYGVEPHSDFHPVVSLDAPRSRFIGSSVQFFNVLSRAGMPVLDITGGRESVSSAEVTDRSTEGVGAIDHWRARFVRDALLTGAMDDLRKSEAGLAAHVEKLRLLSAGPVPEESIDAWLLSATVTSDYSVGYLPAVDHQDMWISPAWIDPAVQPEIVRAVLAAYGAAAARDGAAMQAAGLEALALLGPERPAAVREQMLVVAILGAIAQGHLDEAEQIERERGGEVPPGASYGFVRAYLLAWIDTQKTRGH